MSEFLFIANLAMAFGGLIVITDGISRLTRDLRILKIEHGEIQAGIIKMLRTLDTIREHQASALAFKSANRCKCDQL